MTFVLGLIGAGACAKLGRPPGGPEDRKPPVIVTVTPGPEAAGVAPDSAFSLTFSEKPDRRSVMRALVVFPPVDFRETTWDDTTLTLVPAEGWGVCICDRNKSRRRRLIEHSVLRMMRTWRLIYLF